MRHALVRFLAAPLLALVPASAGTTAPRPVALTAAPARLVLATGDGGTVRITNAGTKRVVVDAAPAGFALDLRGRPRIVGARGVRSAVRWLTLRPRRLTLAARATAPLLVSARVPPHAAPGDHDALVLLSTRPVDGTHVAVRLRLGVVVVVRAPGAIVRRLELRRLRVLHRGGTQALRLVVANRGNVTESLVRVHAELSRMPSGRLLAVVAAGARRLRPQTEGILEFRLHRRGRGRVSVRVVVPGEPGRATIRRTYRLRL
jgi:hypothetical protein